MIPLIMCPIWGLAQVPNRSLSFRAGKSLSMLNASFGYEAPLKFSWFNWIYLNSSASSFWPIIQGNGSPSQTNFGVQITSSGIFGKFWKDGVENYMKGTVTSTTGEWHSLEVQFDVQNVDAASRINVIWDGTNINSGDYSITKTGMDANASTTYIGLQSGSDSVQLLQPAFFYDTLVPISSLVSSGKPRGIKEVGGLASYIHTDNPNIVDDFVLATDWTNNGGVTLDTNIPS